MVHQISLKIVALLLLLTDPAFAHGDQEITYLGTECRLRGDFERGVTQDGCAGTPVGTPWRDLLGVSVFGSVSNINRCSGIPGNVAIDNLPDMQGHNPGDMILTCPIPRGAIRKTSGIQVSLKIETILEWDQNDNERQRINKNARCELLNINQTGTGSSARDTTGNRIVTSALLEFRQSRVATIGLGLASSNASDDFDARGSGGYAITCVLPGMRPEIGGGPLIPSRIIQYTVRESN